MNIIGKQQQISILGVLLRNKDIPLWVTDAYVAKFEEDAVQSEVSFTAKRNATLNILDLPVPKIESFSCFNSPDLRALADATWLRLLKKTPSSETLRELTALLMQNGEVPAYFRRLSWTYLTSKYTTEAEGLCKRILANPLKNKLPLNIDTAAMESGYYEGYRALEDGSTLSPDVLIPIERICEKEGHVWSVFYVRGNRLLMADAHRTFRELKLFDVESPLFPSFCDVLVAVISGSKTPYIQGLTYLCGVTLLYSRTLYEAVGIALRITQTSNVYRSFILMEKERISTVSCTVIKLVSLILEGGCTESSQGTAGSRILSFAKKKRLEEPLRLAHYGFEGYEPYFDFHAGQHPPILQSISFHSTGKDSGLGLSPSSDGIQPDEGSALNTGTNADTPMPLVFAHEHEPAQESPQLLALHKQIRCRALGIFRDNFDTVFNITSAVTSSCVLTVFSKVSFELSLFVMDYLSYTEKLDEAFILMVVALVVVAIVQVSIQLGPKLEADGDVAEGEGALTNEEVAEVLIKGLTKISIPTPRFICCFRDIVDLFKRSELLQHQMQTLDAVFFTINGEA